jgi:hypothetical protein
MLRALIFLNRKRFAVDFLKISNFSEDLTELQSVVRKFAEK